MVFTDLVGSTAIAARLGPEATEALRREHFACLRAGIARHGGREVKNLGDGLMVVFGSASEALAGAVAMLQAVDLRNRRTQGESLSVRVGIATGEADEVDGDYFGQPVVEAARLCDSAAGGQVLATATVQALAGRTEIGLRSLGIRDLKGLADPVAVVEALWEPLADAVDAFGLPDRLASADLQMFVGRRLELDADGRGREGSLGVAVAPSGVGVGRGWDGQDDAPHSVRASGARRGRGRALRTSR